MRFCSLPAVCGSQDSKIGCFENNNGFEEINEKRTGEGEGYFHAVFIWTECRDKCFESGNTYTGVVGIVCYMS